MGRRPIQGAGVGEGKHEETGAVTDLYHTTGNFLRVSC